jgi:hypothetical protein
LKRIDETPVSSSRVLTNNHAPWARTARSFILVKSLAGMYANTPRTLGRRKWGFGSLAFFTWRPWRLGVHFQHFVRSSKLRRILPDCRKGNISLVHYTPLHSNREIQPFQP